MRRLFRIIQTIISPYHQSHPYTKRGTFGHILSEKHLYRKVKDRFQYRERRIYYIFNHLPPYIYRIRATISATGFLFHPIQSRKDSEHLFISFIQKIQQITRDNLHLSRISFFTKFLISLRFIIYDRIIMILPPIIQITHRTSSSRTSHQFTIL